MLALTSGCRLMPEPRFSNFEIRGKEGFAKYDPQSGRLKRLDIDHNKDGALDTFSYWDGPRIIRIEIDSDGDDRIDRWEHYNDANQLASVGSSRLDDGVEDTWTYPDETGRLAKVETDTNRDGTIDKRETFAHSDESSNTRVLSVVDLDIDTAGRPRLRLHYSANGTFERTEVIR